MPCQRCRRSEDLPPERRCSPGEDSAGVREIPRKEHSEYLRRIRRLGQEWACTAFIASAFVTRAFGTAASIESGPLVFSP